MLDVRQLCLSPKQRVQSANESPGRPGVTARELSVSCVDAPAMGLPSEQIINDK
jgi:hypothetical protein